MEDVKGIVNRYIVGGGSGSHQLNASCSRLGYDGDNPTSLKERPSLFPSLSFRGLGSGNNQRDNKMAWFSEQPHQHQPFHSGDLSDSSTSTAAIDPQQQPTGDGLGVFEIMSGEFVVNGSNDSDSDSDMENDNNHKKKKKSSSEEYRHRREGDQEGDDKKSKKMKPTKGKRKKSNRKKKSAPSSAESTAAVVPQTCGVGCADGGDGAEATETPRDLHWHPEDHKTSSDDGGDGDRGEASTEGGKAAAASAAGGTAGPIINSNNKRRDRRGSLKRQSSSRNKGPSTIRRMPALTTQSSRKRLMLLSDHDSPVATTYNSGTPAEGAPSPGKEEETNQVTSGDLPCAPAKQSTSSGSLESLAAEVEKKEQPPPSSPAKRSRKEGGGGDDLPSSSTAEKSGSTGNLNSLAAEAEKKYQPHPSSSAKRRRRKGSTRQKNPDSDAGGNALSNGARSSSPSAEGAGPHHHHHHHQPQLHHGRNHHHRRHRRGSLSKQGSSRRLLKASPEAEETPTAAPAGGDAGTAQEAEVTDPAPKTSRRRASLSRKGSSRRMLLKGVSGSEEEAPAADTASTEALDGTEAAAAAAADASPAPDTRHLTRRRAVPFKQGSSRRLLKPSSSNKALEPVVAAAAAEDSEPTPDPGAAANPEEEVVDGIRSHVERKDSGRRMKPKPAPAGAASATRPTTSPPADAAAEATPGGDGKRDACPRIPARGLTPCNSGSSCSSTGSNGRASMLSRIGGSMRNLRIPSKGSTKPSLLDMAVPSELPAARSKSKDTGKSKDNTSSLESALNNSSSSLPVELACNDDNTSRSDSLPPGVAKPGGYNHLITLGASLSSFRTNPAEDFFNFSSGSSSGSEPEKALSGSGLTNAKSSKSSSNGHLAPVQEGESNARESGAKGSSSVVDEKSEKEVESLPDEPIFDAAVTEFTFLGKVEDDGDAKKEEEEEEEEHHKQQKKKKAQKEEPSVKQGERPRRGRRTSKHKGEDSTKTGGGGVPATARGTSATKGKRSGARGGGEDPVSRGRSSSRAGGKSSVPPRSVSLGVKSRRRRSVSRGPGHGGQSTRRGRPPVTKKWSSEQNIASDAHLDDCGFEFDDGGRWSHGFGKGDGCDKKKKASSSSSSSTGNAKPPPRTMIRSLSLSRLGSRRKIQDECSGSLGDNGSTDTPLPAAVAGTVAKLAVGGSVDATQKVQSSHALFDLIRPSFGGRFG